MNKNDILDGPPVIVDVARVEAAVKELLAAVGEDPNRQGLLETPARVARSYVELLGGYAEDPIEHLERQFDVEFDEMIMVRDIPFNSMCEHHMLPFVGHAHVAYLPGKEGRICGLSKLARVVDGYARRLQVQERLTAQIADAMTDALDPEAALVVVEAEHYCMKMRGVRKWGAMTTTSAVRGLFKTNHASRAEALSLLRSGS